MFTTFLIQPIYNAFVYLVDVLPGGDMGLAIIVLTIFMRLVLYPVFSSSIRTQMGMQAMQGELDEVSKKYKNNPQELAKARIELLKKYKVNPFAGFFALIIQLVVVIALYYALFRQGFPEISEGLLYGFVHAPETVNTVFLGVLNLLTSHHIALALIVGATQYLTIWFTLRRTNAAGQPLTPDKVAAQRMQHQMMLYVMPALMAVISYTFPGAVGLYFTASNVLSLGQEWLIRRQMAS